MVSASPWPQLLHVPCVVVSLVPSHLLLPSVQLVPSVRVREVPSVLVTELPSVYVNEVPPLREVERPDEFVR